MTDISYVEDLDSTANITAMANKLLYKVKESWRKFGLVDFVTQQIKYLLQLLYSVRQKPKPQSSVTFKSRKVFTIVAVPTKMENNKQTLSKTQPVSVDACSKPCVY